VTIGIIGLVVLLFLFITGMEMAFLMAVIGAFIWCYTPPRRILMAKGFSLEIDPWVYRAKIQEDGRWTE
jgi:hypothetical protein